MSRTHATDRTNVNILSTLTRRRLLRLLAGGASLGFVGGLLSACGGPSLTGNGTQPTAPASTMATKTPAMLATPSSNSSPVTTTTAYNTASPPANVTTPAASPNSLIQSSADTLVIGATLDNDSMVFNSLDPARFRIVSYYGNMIARACYDTLVSYVGNDFKSLSPSLATMWSVSADGLTYTFSIQDGVMFASGNPLTSDDVVWSINRVINIKSDYGRFLDEVESVAAPASTQVVVKLSKAEPELIANLAMPAFSILDSVTVKANGGDATAAAVYADQAETYLNAASAGTGPYVLQSSNPTTEIILVGNPICWRGKPALKRIAVRAVDRLDEQRQQVGSGEIDVALNVSSTNLESLQANDAVVVTSASLPVNYCLLMNNSHPEGGIFSNPKVQQAVRYALDYEGILKIAGLGSSRIAGVIPPVLSGAMDSSTAVQTDLSKARALLKEANLEAFQGTLKVLSGLRDYGVDLKSLSSKIRDDLVAAGIDLTLTDVPASDTVATVTDSNFEAIVLVWIGTSVDPNVFLTFAPDWGVGSNVGWTADSNGEAQAIAGLADQSTAEVDPQKRIALFQEFDQRVSEAGPYASLFAPAQLFAVRANVTGANFNPFWYLDLTTVGKS